MGFKSYINQDAAVNHDNTKGKLVTRLFRVAQYGAQGSRIHRAMFAPYHGLYRLLVEWLMGIELPWTASVGPGLRIYHGQATVVHKHAVLGRNCTLRQCTTIGNAREGGGVPTIGDNVEIGANVCIVGEISIGDHVIIGVGSVVVRSVPPYSVVVGNPARVIKTLASQV